MTAEPLLNKVASVLAEHRLEAVMVSNAAALHGAPVTKFAIDFMFRRTRANIRRLKAVARKLDATIFKQLYPPAELYRMMNDDWSFCLDFVPKKHKLYPFEADQMKTRTELQSDSISNDALSAWDPVEAIGEMECDALKKESERALIDQIRRLLALPMNKRTNFLRVRRPGGGSHL